MNFLYAFISPISFNMTIFPAFEKQAILKVTADGHTSAQRKLTIAADI